jgi:hypothetical protein
MPELSIRPWLSIWTQPRQTVRALIDYNVKFRFWILCVVYGLPTLFQTAQNFSLGQVLTLPGIFLLCLILSPLIGYIGLSICSLLIAWTGRWIGGKGSYLEVRCAVAWTNSTNLVTTFIWLCLTLQFGQILFYEGFIRMPMTVSESAWLSGYFLIQFVVAIWSFVLLVLGVAEAHRFSAWKSLLNIAMAFLVGVGVSWILLFALDRILDLRV